MGSGVSEKADLPAAGTWRGPARSMKKLVSELRYQFLLC